MTVKQKGVNEYFADDPSLAEKFTYEEFFSEKGAAPANEDVTIEQAFNTCMEICDKLEETV